MTAEIEYEDYPDLCPVCRVYGTQPCIDEDGRDMADHEDRTVTVWKALEGFTS